MTIQQILFILIAAVILGSAVLVVTTRNLFHAALFLVVSFFGVAGFYVLLDAGFFAAAQVLVYIGAISILFIFAVMLTRDVITSQRANSQWIAAAVIAGTIFVVMALLLGPAAIDIRGRQFGNVQWPFALANDGALREVSPTFVGDLGRALVDFNQFAVPFLLGAVMLLVAMVGAIWVARDIRLRDALIEEAATAYENTEPPDHAPESTPIPDSAVAAAPAADHH
jgi:NADH:ubiquinone oxidoreductase subunit 6 (subunit J)